MTPETQDADQIGMYRRMVRAHHEAVAATRRARHDLAAEARWMCERFGDDAERLMREIREEALNKASR